MDVITAKLYWCILKHFRAYAQNKRPKAYARNKLYMSCAIHLALQMYRIGPKVVHSHSWFVGHVSYFKYPGDEQARTGCESPAVRAICRFARPERRHSANLAKASSVLASSKY
jgi:hypothetical protein